MRTLILALLSVSAVHAETVKIYLFADHYESSCQPVTVTPVWVATACDPGDFTPILWRIGELATDYKPDDEHLWALATYVHPFGWSDSGVKLLDMDEDGRLLASSGNIIPIYSHYGTLLVADDATQGDLWHFPAWEELPDPSTWTHVPHLCNDTGTCFGSDEIGTYYTTVLPAPEPRSAFFAGAIAALLLMHNRTRAKNHPATSD